MDSRLFPPIGALRALEASVRLGSFSEAAVELGVSQSAVSQSIRQLERQLGVMMFRREPGRVHPTNAAQRYAASVKPALAAIHAAGFDVRKIRTVVIGCSRALLNNWLLARAVRDEEDLGSVDLRALDRMPKTLDGLDIALLYGERPGFEGARLLHREVLVAVGASHLVRSLEGPLETSGQAPRAKLLGDHWSEWMEMERVPAASVRLTETSALLAAALGGRGFALLPRLVCADWLRSGDLMLSSERTLDQGRGYWLLAHGPDETVGACADWIRGLFRNLRLEADPGPMAHWKDIADRDLC